MNPYPWQHTLLPAIQLLELATMNEQIPTQYYHWHNTDASIRTPDKSSLTSPSGATMLSVLSRSNWSS